MKKETFEKLQRWGLIKKKLSWDDFQERQAKVKSSFRELKEEIEKSKEKAKQNRPEELRKIGRMFAIGTLLCFLAGLLFPPFLIFALLNFVGLLIVVAMKYLE